MLTIAKKKSLIICYTDEISNIKVIIKNVIKIILANKQIIILKIHIIPLKAIYYILKFFFLNKMLFIFYFSHNTTIIVKLTPSFNLGHSKLSLNITL